MQSGDLAAIMLRIEAAVNHALLTTVADEVRAAIGHAVQTEVYDKYEPDTYERRGMSKGGLMDTSAENMPILAYDPDEHSVEIGDMSEDKKTGRLIAPVVESGRGYTWEGSRIYKMQPFPRPFHSVAEENVVKSGAVSRALKRGMAQAGVVLE